MPLERRGRSPDWKTKKTRGKASRKPDPETRKCQKVEARETATFGLSCPRRAATRRLSRPRPASSTRSHCELGPITVGYSPNSGYLRILCLPSIQLKAVRFPYFPLLRHRVHHRYRRCCYHRRLQEPVSQQPSCPCAAEQDGIEKAGRPGRERESGAGSDGLTGYRQTPPPTCLPAGSGHLLECACAWTRLPGLKRWWPMLRAWKLADAVTAEVCWGQSYFPSTKGGGSGDVPLPHLLHPCTGDPAHVPRTESGCSWLRPLDFGVSTSPGAPEMGFPPYATKPHAWEEPPLSALSFGADHSAGTFPNGWGSVPFPGLPVEQSAE